MKAMPMGSLTKREIEMTFLRGAIESGLLKPHPEVLAIELSMSMTRAHGFLNDLALRQPQLPDLDAVKQLVVLLKNSEVVRSDSHLLIPLHDVALRIWLERKMTILRLNSGETMRRDIVKLTPAGLVKLIGSTEGILAPYEALNKLPKDLSSADWVKEAKNS